MSYVNRITVNKLQRKPGTWMIRTNVATFGTDGRRLARLQRYVTFKGTEEQAEVERNRVLGEARGTDPLLAEGGDTVASFGTAWVASRERDKRGVEAAETERTRRNRLYLYVVPAWGHLRLDCLDHGEVLSGARWLARQQNTRTGERLTATTVKHALDMLQAIVAAAAWHGKANLLACDFPGVKRDLLAQAW
jgi:hypothetical protein